MPPPADEPRSAAEPALELLATDIRKSFGQRTVIDGVSFQIACGQIVAIVGASGSGKTVLLDIITGLLAADSGSVRVADHDAPSWPPPLVELAELDEDARDAVRLHWAVVFQRNALFSGTVYENIALWLREHTELDEPQILERARASLAAVSLDVDDVLYKQRDALSGGMAKRVAIARAIAVEPLVTFYDEPTTGLDPVLSGHIHELIWNTHHMPPITTAAGPAPRTSVIVTHDKDLLRRLHPRIIMLDGGKVSFDGSYADFGRAASPAARHYLQSMPALHAREM